MTWTPPHTFVPNTMASADEVNENFADLPKEERDQVWGFTLPWQDGATADVTAVEEMEIIKRLQAEWSDNAVSATVYVRRPEVPAIKQWLRDNYKDGVKAIDYKDTNLLRKFISDRGKIRSRRVTGLTMQQQRAVAKAVKNAREMALLPYTSSAR